MKQNTFKSTLALVAIAFLTACGSDELPADPSFDQDIKTELVDKSQLPEWLADYVSYLEYVPEGQELPTEKSGIYRFEWNGQTYYELYSPSQTMMHDNLFSSNGTPVRLVEDDYKSLTDNAHDWTIVYLLQPSHQPLQNHAYPAEVHEYDSFFERAMSSPRDFKFDMFKFKEYLYAINSEEQFESEKASFAILYWPKIDFSKYTLVIGRVNALRHTSLKRQEIMTGSEGSILRLYYERNLKMGEFFEEDTIEIRPFWALYPKIQDKKLNIEVIANNRPYGNITKEVVISDPMFGENWEPIGGKLPFLISKEIFEYYVYGKHWVNTEVGEILPDGRVYERRMTGGSLGYIFEDNHVIQYGYSDGLQENYQIEFQFDYDENTNKLQIGDETYYLLSIDEDEMTLVFEHKTSKRIIYWMMIFNVSDKKKIQVCSTTSESCMNSRTFWN
jgi:hypothetical protein